MWKLERDEEYFRIFDENKNIAGYFEPEYGEIFPESKYHEIIQEMHKKREKISGGYLMVPMVKFGVFDDEQEMELDYLNARLDETKERILKWQKFISSQKNTAHRIHVSHTDQDMLSITFPISFTAPVPLDKKLILDRLETTLNSLHELGLL
ncbi:MAG: hypothetical protein ACREAF_03105 [Nitrosopumilaceae archaeon]